MSDLDSRVTAFSWRDGFGIAASISDIHAYAQRFGPDDAGRRPDSTARSVSILG
jgi:hypothetical protein